MAASDGRELVIAFVAEQLMPAAVTAFCCVRREQNDIRGTSIEDARCRGENCGGGQALVALATREVG